MHKKILIGLFLSFLCVSVSIAQEICPLTNRPIVPREVSSYSTFKEIAILENGRVKPLDTFARNLLLRLSGKTEFNKKDAVVWLTRLLFAPGETAKDKIFLINNPDIAKTLGIKVDEHRRYSFSELEPHFEQISQLAQAADKIDSKKRDLVESELLRVYENVRTYSLLSLSFSFLMPNQDFTVTDPQLMKIFGLTGKGQQMAFFDVAMQADALQNIIAPVAKMPQSQWTPTQKDAIALVNNLFNWSSLYHDLPFTIIPSYEKSQSIWLSPWDAMTNGIQIDEGRAELDALNQMSIAYWKGDQINFDLGGKTFIGSIQKRASENILHKISRVNLELLFNQLNLFFWTKFLYMIIFFWSMFAVFGSSEKIRQFNFNLMVAAFFMNLLGLFMRITILQRPPVSNLYETFIFVAFIAVLCGLIIESLNKNWIGIIVGSICGYLFLTIAGKFGMDGDTMQVLVAVLDSNFWLSTHVTSITIGYAGACVAGVLGHIYLLQAIFRPADKKLLLSTQKILIGALAFGLAMTFLGTNLGGIWADQSWGRFWGWDPKENGALMIVLWTALLFHSKIAKMIGPIGLAVGSALGIIVVMWAWFGVNLLSIGLHSYGFTTGLAVNLAIYVVCQILFLLIITPIAQRKLKS